jgi:hypothetical protein
VYFEETKYVMWKVKYKIEGSFSLPQDLSWQHWKIWRMLIIRTFPHFHLCSLFPFYLSSDKTTTRVTWLLADTTRSDGVKTGEICGRMTFQYSDNCMGHRKVYECVEKIQRREDKCCCWWWWCSFWTVIGCNVLKLRSFVSVSGTTEEWELIKFHLESSLDIERSYVVIS